MGNGAALRELLLSLGVEVDDDQLDQVLGKLRVVKREATQIAPPATGQPSRVDDFTESLKKLGAAMATYFSIRELIGGLEESLTATKDLADAARRTGLEFESLQEWAYAADDVGAGLGDLEMGFKTLRAQIVSAGQGSEESQAAFRALGVSISDADGVTRSTNEIFRDAGLALAQVEDEAQRSALAVKLFGRGGNALVPIFARGQAGLDAWNQELSEMGLRLDRDMIDQLLESEDAWDKIGHSWRGVKLQLTTALAPAIEQVGNGLTGVNQVLQELTKSSAAWNTAIYLLTAATVVYAVTSAKAGQTAAAAWLAANGPIVAAVAALAAILAVSKDVFDLFSGNQSVIGDVLKGWGVDLDAFLVAWNAFTYDVIDFFASIPRMVKGAFRWITSLGGLIGDGPLQSLGEFVRDEVQGAQAPSMQNFRGPTARELGQTGAILSAAERISPAQIMSTAPANVRGGDVRANITINAQGANANDVSRIVQRELGSFMTTTYDQALDEIASTTD